MKHENGSSKKLAVGMILKWIICIALSFAILVPCILIYQDATKPPEGVVYTGKAQGMLCEIVAEVTVAGDRIVDVKLTGAEETPELGGVVLAEMPAKILEAQTTNVDGIAGATVTSDAARKAVTEALIDAGLLIPVTGDVYTGTAQGFAGEVAAEIIVADGVITDVKLTGAGETPELGGKAIEQMPAKILEAQSADVDGVAGATMTSNGVREAVTDALVQAGLIVPSDEAVYTGTAQGANGEVTAEVTVSGGEVLDVKLAGDVLSQDAVQTAIQDALTQAGIEVPTEPAPAAEEPAPAGEVYTGKAQGMLCEIVAEVTVADGKIVDVKLTGDAETPALGGVVLEEMPAKIIEAQSADVDGMTGATVTTEAVKKAVSEALTAAGLGAAEEPAPIENEPAPAGEVYTGKAQGMLCEIVAEVTVADGKIVDVKLTGDAETPALGGVVLEEMPAKIIEAQSADVDGMTGATVTTEAVKKAVADALTQAGLLETPAEEPAPATEEPAPAETEAVAAVPTAGRENGVITADEWEGMFPEIVASYKANGENTYILDYLEEDPYLVSIYEGYGFAKQYGSARGHEYCLEDLGETARPHPLANCLTCKTADFTKLVNDLGVEAYSMDFETVFADMSENVGCYNCHGNEAAEDGKLVVTHDYIIDQLGENMNAIDPATLSCGQCHIEYYFVPETKATSVPYTDVAGMDPTAILAYYDAMDFADWTQPSTGTRLLKAQHPEMETYLNGSIHATMGMSCASCHMEKLDGYTSHELVSPLESETILQTCAACHKDVDMGEKVHAIQEQVTARETVIGGDLAAFKEKLAEAVASGEYTEEELNAIRKLHREAQWYFDFDYVENSEGAHNSRLANSCLDKAESLIAEGMKLFKEPAVEEPAVETEPEETVVSTDGE